MSDYDYYNDNETKQPVFKVFMLAPYWESIQKSAISLAYVENTEVESNAWFKSHSLNDCLTFGEKVADLDNVIEIEKIDYGVGVSPYNTNQTWLLLFADSKWIETTQQEFFSNQFRADINPKVREVVKNFGTKYLEEKYWSKHFSRQNDR